ncbi:LEAF RUST 10 DISEASE-RESISTANCE LOCUS RECEPTOR-LIKE PROTEIN KINASE-like 1.1 [Pistacia vera]|uniref:LEAF RUST 10 DISEASE-RESISTANCE LOCUS RECEPTOR-LIKE PROTEIN KINASE-like 1.1 n=1 Tax=Pistacia vera TaxID=55513 RepID=UPI001263C47E|nr:LEAF RUST 10 DISEASE-RESISTANCE LOCUS RECEPTOR-LIKE PROTEIN KINASE-like 1.1 [Pistacia vera]
MASVLYLVIFTIFHLFVHLSLADEETVSNPRCPSFQCGDLGFLHFPFYNGTHPECGFFIVDNCNEQIQKIQLGKGGPWFYVTGISQDNTLRLQENQNQTSDLHTIGCKSLLKSLTLFIPPFISVEPYPQNLFNCSRISDINSNYVSLCNDSKHSIYKKLPRTVPCSSIQFLVNKSQTRVEILNLYTGRFRLQVNVSRECRHRRKGECQIDSRGKFHCSNSRTGNLLHDPGKSKQEKQS